MDPALKDCDICYKIICRNCKWEASNEEISMIQKGQLINCPECGWRPSN